MRVLFQYFSGGGGGLSNVILLLKAYLRNYPDDYVVVVCSAGSELLTLREFPNAEVVVVDHFGSKEFARLRLGLYRLRQIAKEHCVDVVWSLNVGPYVALGLPSVLSLNNAHQVYPWAITRLHPGSRLRVALLRFFFRRSLRSVDGVMVQTPLMGKYVADICGAPDKICVVPKAVERSDDVLARSLPDVIADRLNCNRAKWLTTWLYVSTCMPHKNHFVLIEAFALLRKRGIAARLVVTISEEELCRVGGELAAELILAGVIVPVGWISKEHLRALYDTCDACVMPSLLESLSSAHLEAMEWGKPQILADLPYSRDLCGDAAVYVNASDPIAWAEAIESVGADAELASGLINRGRERISRFPATWDESAGLVRQFLTSICSADTKFL